MEPLASVSKVRRYLRRSLVSGGVYISKEVDNDVTRSCGAIDKNTLERRNISLDAGTTSVSDPTQTQVTGRVKINDTTRRE